MPPHDPFATSPPPRTGREAGEGMIFFFPSTSPANIPPAATSTPFLRYDDHSWTLSGAGASKRHRQGTGFFHIAHDQEGEPGHPGGPISSAVPHPVPLPILITPWTSSRSASRNRPAPAPHFRGLPAPPGAISCRSAFAFSFYKLGLFHCIACRKFGFCLFADGGCSSVG